MLALNSDRNNIDLFDLRTADMVTSITTSQKKEIIESANFDLSGSSLIYQIDKNLNFAKVLDDKIEPIQNYSQNTFFRS